MKRLGIVAMVLGAFFLGTFVGPFMGIINPHAIFIIGGICFCLGVLFVYTAPKE